MPAPISRFAALLAFLAVTLCAALPAPAPAQEAATAETTEEAAPRSELDLLLEVIEDDISRAALIEQLRAAQGAEGTTPADELVETLAGDAPPPPESLSFSRRIALVTQEAAEGIAARMSSLWIQVTRIPQVFDGFSGGEAGVLWEALQQLFLIILATVAVYLLLRRAGKRVYRRMGARARESGALRTTLLFIASALIDALIVIVAWAAGYLIATLLLGEFGQIGIRQTLYLNAFLLVEMVKVVLRMVLSPTAADLRPLPISTEAARYLNRRLSIMVSLVGYGQLLVVPILNTNVSFAAGRALSALVALVVVGMAIWLVLRNRRPVADWLERGATTDAPAPEAQVAPAAAPAPLPVAETDTPEEFPLGTPEPDEPAHRRGALGLLARNWHYPVLLYLVVMLVLVLVQPGDAAFRSLLNSGQVLVVVLLGITLSGVLTRMMVRGVQLPGSVTERLPLLERRLNTFVPKALFVLRLVIFVLVVAFALNAISLIDLRAWMASQIGLRLTSTLFSVAAVLLVAFLIWVALSSWVDYRLNPEFGSVATAREKTLLTLARNAATIALVIITLMFVLSEIGLDIAPLLASAGVLGLAIGFGAQKLVQDIITGIFIQFENAMNVGDVVSVGGTTGGIEKLTIRSVSLRDVNGTYHLIPFSSVDMVSNYNREFAYSVCDMGVAYRENLEDVKQAMHDAFDKLREDEAVAANIIGDLEWFGLNSFGDSAVVVRTRIKCLPGTQWGVGRAYNGVLKEIFDARNIEIPFPHQTIFLGEAKDGSTQRFRIAKSDETAEG